VLALALIHHLAIGNNVPLGDAAAFLRQLAPDLIIEFVPKCDSQVQRLLAPRTDIFPNYTREGFESAFKTFFTIVRAQALSGSDRVTYLMQDRSVRARKRSTEEFAR
jgi:hypothetical protein